MQIWQTIFAITAVVGCLTIVYFAIRRDAKKSAQRDILEENQKVRDAQDAVPNQSDSDTSDSLRDGTF